MKHSSLVNVLLAVKQCHQFNPSSSLLAITTISFDISANELFTPLLARGCVYIGEDGLAGDGFQLAERVERLKLSHFQATVSTFKTMLVAGWKGNPDLQLISGGEALDWETAENLLGKCQVLWNDYGPTETTVYSSVYQVQSSPGKPMQIGRPLVNTQMYVLDRLLQPLPIGAVGDLFISGAGLAAGYWRKPDLTAGRFISNPFRPGELMYRTGDLARYLPDGNLICLGRQDDQVKIHGVRIEHGRD